jgi:hypothetical protein
MKMNDHHKICKAIIDISLSILFGVLIILVSVYICKTFIAPMLIAIERTLAPFNVSHTLNVVLLSVATVGIALSILSSYFTSNSEQQAQLLREQAGLRNDVCEEMQSTIRT